MQVSLNILLNKLLDQLYNFYFPLSKDNTGIPQETVEETDESICFVCESLIPITVVAESFIIHL